MPLPPLREVIARHELRATKSLGQNFLLDLNLTARIARGAGDLSGRSVIEIGPGPGGLTRALLDSPAREVIAVEFDLRAVAALAELKDVYGDRLTILHADALRTDCAMLGAAPRAIVANLPYNIATPLLIGWLKQVGAFESLTLMFQREVAERIVAKPGGKSYGRLAVMVGWLCDARILFDVAPQAFTPPPKVTSSVVRLVPRLFPSPSWEGEGVPPRIAHTLTRPATPVDLSHEGEVNMPTFAVMERVVAAAFGQRRKMLRSALQVLGVDVEALLAAADLDPTDRAETVDVAGFTRLARAYSDLGDTRKSKSHRSGEL